jgi:hypothetical protein
MRNHKGLPMNDNEEFNDDLPRWSPNHLSLTTLLNNVNALKSMSPFFLQSVINSIGLYGHLEILYTTKKGLSIQRINGSILGTCINLLDVFFPMNFVKLKQV